MHMSREEHPHSLASTAMPCCNQVVITPQPCLTRKCSAQACAWGTGVAFHDRHPCQADESWTSSCLPLLSSASTEGTPEDTLLGPAGGLAAPSSALPAELAVPGLLAACAWHHGSPRARAQRVAAGWVCQVRKPAPRPHKLLARPRPQERYHGDQSMTGMHDKPRA